jgi:hypothetical protein
VWKHEAAVLGDRGGGKLLVVSERHAAVSDGEREYADGGEFDESGDVLHLRGTGRLLQPPTELYERLRYEVLIQHFI